jgi:alkylation response protein AidB-like acyl-CoA dehydrogenase
MRDYPVERFFRAAKATQLYEGTNEILRQLIAKHLLS